MAAQSFLAKAGMRSATMGSAGSLAIALPLTEGSYDPAAHTDASRTGVYGVTGVSLSTVVNGSVILTAGVSALTSTVIGVFPASTTSAASIRLPHGTAPTTPVNGDMWTTTAGVFAQINGSTVGPFGSGSGSIGGSIALNQVAYGSGANTIQGSAALTFDGADLSTTGRVLVAGGTASLPGFSAFGDPDTGMYFVAANDLGFSTNGVQRLDISTTAVTSTLIGVFPATSTTAASIRLPHGTAPTTPVNGDMWTTTAGVFAQINGSTVGPFGSGSGSIGGSIAATQIAVGSGTNTISGSASLIFTSNTLTTLQAATQDAIALTGRAGGTSSFVATFTPGVLTSSITLTTPLASGTLVTGASTANRVAVFSGVNSIGAIGGGTWTATLAGGSGTESFSAGSSTATATQSIRSSSVTSSGALAASAVFTLGSFTLDPTPSGTVGAGATYYGLSGIVANSGSNNTRLATASMYGVLAQGTFTTGVIAGTTLTDVGALIAQPSVVGTNASGSATITNAYGINIQPTTFSASSGGTIVITNYYGLRIQTLTTSGAGTFTITNRYGLYQDSTSALNYFGGVLGVGGATPSTTTALITPASTTGVSSLRIPAGTAPTSPVDGDVWTTTAAMFVRINGATQQLGTGTISGTGTANRVPRFTGTSSIGDVANGTWSIVGISGAMFEAFTSSPYTGTASATLRNVTVTLNGTPAASSVFTGMAVGITTNTAALAGANSAYYAFVSSTDSNASATVRHTTTTIYSALSSFTHQNGAIGTNTVLQEGGGHIVTLSLIGTGTSGSQTHSAIYGINVVPGTFSSASGGTQIVTNYYGLRLQTLTTSGAGTFTITNRYGIYQDDTAASNFFAGNMAVGNATLSASTALGTPASTTTVSSLRIPAGTAPTSPVDGDVWTTTAAMFVRINGSTQQLGTGTIGGSIANTQVAIGSGTNTISGFAAWTSVVASGAQTESFASGSSTATTTTTIRSTSATSTGALGASAVFTTASFSLDANPGSAVSSGAIYTALTGSFNNTASTNARLQSASAYGINASATYNTAINSVSTILTDLGGLIVNTSIVKSSTTNATVTNAYGINIVPGTYSVVGSGTITLTNYYGLRLQTLTTSGAGTFTITNRYGIYQDDTAASNYFGGLVGIGLVTNTAANGIFQVVKTTVDTSGNSITCAFTTTVNPGSASTAAYYGTYATTSTAAAAAANMTSASLVSHFVSPTFNVSTTANGTLALMNGFRAEPVVNNSGASGRTLTVTTLAAFYARPQMATSTSGATSTITSYYGIFLDAPVATGSGTNTITNRYGVYQADTAASNFFAGVVGVGNASPSATTALNTPASTTGVSSLRLAHGSAPTSPVNGDVWSTTLGFFSQINGVTAPMNNGLLIYNSYAGNQSLTVANNYVEYTGTGGDTFTLPAANSGGSFSVILYVKNKGSGTLTVARAGADTIDGATSISVLSGQSVILISNTSTAWGVN